MRSKDTKLKIFLIFFGVIYIISFVLTTRIELNIGNLDNSNRYTDMNEKNLKISEVRGKIYIYNNWSAAVSTGICTGNGTYAHPYIIENFIIDAGSSGSPINIRSSDVFFEIRNCIVYGAEENPLIYDPHFGGIHLLSVSNAKIYNNTCSFNSIGILLQSCDNSTFMDNKINNNTEFGMDMYTCDLNKISVNTIFYNEYSGIRLFSSHNNTFSDNILNYNGDDAMWIDGSSSSRYINNITGNVANYNTGTGISIRYSVASYISGNNLNYNGGHGIFLRDCNISTVIENNATNNNYEGINLYNSDNINITENCLNYNSRYGLYLRESDNNIISDNEFIGNPICWVQDEFCVGNTFKNNICIVPGGIPGYNFFLLVVVLFITAIILNRNRSKC